MRFQRALGLSFFIVSLITVLSAQQQPTTGTTPLALLSQSLESAGGQSAISAVQDFTAHGTITYFYSPTNQKSGRVTVEGRGDSQFRMDSDVDGGTISWAVSNGAGQRKDSKGILSDIPFYNATMLGSLTLPHLKLAHALHDPGSELSYVGLQSIGGTSFHQIKVIRHLPKEQDPKDVFAGLRSTDYYLSSTDLKIIGIVDKVHPNRLGIGFDSHGRLISKDLQHAVYFSDFRQVNGVLVPFSITEELAHQRMWSIQLTDIAFNTGLGDVDFTLK